MNFPTTPPGFGGYSEPQLPTEDELRRNLKLGYVSCSEFPA
jgi:hypothetical protein